MNPVEDSMVAANRHNGISNNPTDMLPVSIHHNLLNLMVDNSLCLCMKGSMKRDILEKKQNNFVGNLEIDFLLNLLILLM